MRIKLIAPKGINMNDIDELGYKLYKNIFNTSEINGLIKAVDEIEERQRKSGLILDYEESSGGIIQGDIFAHNELEPYHYILGNEKFSSVIKDVVGDSPFYFGESNIHVGIGGRGYHKDNRYSSRNTASIDYDSDYSLYRFAIYLHDSDLYSGGVKLVPESNKIPSSKFYFKGKNIAAKAGDIVVWKLTTTHSGNAIRLKLIPNLSLHPRLEGLIPSWMLRSNPSKRRSIFVVIGKQDRHLDNYLEYYSSRLDNQQFLAFNRPFAQNVISLNGYSYNFKMPTSDYGVKWNLQCLK
jgi:hypothetical protein